MASIIPQETIDNILDRLDIVEIISSYIPLKRAGRNLKAPCPFHHEKTPSFMVSMDKQIYHCFGCGAGGNSLSFLMQYEKIEFLEAIEILAKKAGVEIRRLHGQDREQDLNLKTKLRKINELTSFFYHKNLLALDVSKVARDYLSKRGITEKLVKDMRLGFALDKWDGLLEYLKNRGINPGLVAQLGLVIAKDNGGFYDRFRNRIIFPIFDIKSNVIGFGARVLDKSLPKYINSPETPLYVKGRHLYGLNFSKDKIREKDSCLVVEGYLDFLTPYSCGIDNIVASLGTALTRDQIRLIKRYTHNVVMIYDSDLSGELATLRSLDLLIEEGLSVKVVSLQKGYDPDLFVRKFGPDAFGNKINRAISLFDYKLDFLKSRYDSGNIEHKAKIIDEMLITINKFNNAVVKADYFRRLSHELDVAESAIILEAGKVKKQYSLSHVDGTKEKLEAKDKLAGLQNKTRAFEKLLVRLMLEEEELIHKMRDLVSVSEFQDKHLRKIVQTMFELTKLGKSVSPNKLLTCFSDPQTASVVCEVSAIDETIVNKEEVVEECIFRLKKEAVKTAQHRLGEEIKDAQKVKDEKRLSDLLREFNALAKRKVER